MTRHKNLYFFFLGFALLLTTITNVLASNGTSIIRRRRIEPRDVTAANAGDGGLWTRFCNDLDCSEGCGVDVSVLNPLCFNEFGRRSMLVHAGLDLGYSMIMSHSPHCQTMDDCQQYHTTTVEAKYDSYECWELPDWEWEMRSIQFVADWCGQLSCPTFWKCEDILSRGRIDDLDDNQS